MAAEIPASGPILIIFDEDKEVFRTGNFLFQWGWELDKNTDYVCLVYIKTSERPNYPNIGKFRIDFPGGSYLAPDGFCNFHTLAEESPPYRYRWQIKTPKPLIFTAGI